MYGWTHSQILELTPRLFFLYLEQASKIEAAQQLFHIEAASYPNMSGNNQRKISRHYNKIVRPPVLLTKVEQESSWNILRANAPLRARKRNP